MKGGNIMTQTKTNVDFWEMEDVLELLNLVRELERMGVVGKKRVLDFFQGAVFVASVKQEKERTAG